MAAAKIVESEGSQEGSPRFPFPFPLSASAFPLPFNYITMAAQSQRNSSTASYLILSAGAIGAFTALYLAQLVQQQKSTLVDRKPFPNPMAAARDLNKIIRADYDRSYVHASCT